MRINNNMAALNAWRSLTTNGSNMTKSLEKLSSGYRINKAGDDAAGLAVSEKMRAQIRGMNMAARNAQDGVSLVQTAEGGAAKIGDMLQRMRELAVQSASDGLHNDDRALLEQEFDQLVLEIDRVAGDSVATPAVRGVQFNGRTLLDGTLSAAGVKVQVGANAGEEIEIKIDGLKSTLLNGLKADGVTVETMNNATIASQTGAADAIGILDGAIKTVNGVRATLGAYQNRLENAIGTLQTQVENITSAESRIRDVDMASEMAQFTKHNILQQASTSMLAQANQSTQGILSLLR